MDTYRFKVSLLIALAFVRPTEQPPIPTRPTFTVTCSGVGLSPEELSFESQYEGDKEGGSHLTIYNGSTWFVSYSPTGVILTPRDPSKVAVGGNQRLQIVCVSGDNHICMSTVFRTNDGELTFDESRETQETPHCSVTRFHDKISTIGPNAANPNVDPNQSQLPTGNVGKYVGCVVVGIVIALIIIFIIAFCLVNKGRLCFKKSSQIVVDGPVHQQMSAGNSEGSSPLVDLHLTAVAAVPAVNPTPVLTPAEDHSSLTDSFDDSVESSPLIDHHSTAAGPAARSTPVVSPVADHSYLTHSFHNNGESSFLSSIASQVVFSETEMRSAIRDQRAGMNRDETLTAEENTGTDSNTEVILDDEVPAAENVERIFGVDVVPMPTEQPIDNPAKDPTPRNSKIFTLMAQQGKEMFAGVSESKAFILTPLSSLDNGISYPIQWEVMCYPIQWEVMWKDPGNHDIPISKTDGQ